jgi:hypothetical protein
MPRTSSYLSDDANKLLAKLTDAGVVNYLYATNPDDRPNGERHVFTYKDEHGVTQEKKLSTPKFTAFLYDLAARENSSPSVKVEMGVEKVEPAPQPGWKWFTVKLEAGNDDGTVWQSLHPSENVDAKDARDAGEWLSGNQNIVRGGRWRVCVWPGRNADTGVEPVYVIEHRSREGGER